MLNRSVLPESLLSPELNRSVLAESLLSPELNRSVLAESLPKRYWLQWRPSCGDYAVDSDLRSGLGFCGAVLPS